MRLIHLVLAVFVTAIVLAVARDTIGRVALVIFATAMGLIFLGTSSLLLLFRTVGSIGTARTLGHYAEAVAATIGVLFFGTFSMVFVLWCGATILQKVVS